MNYKSFLILFLFIIGLYQQVFSFDYEFIGYVNKSAIFKNNIIKPALLFSPEDSTFYMENADPVIKINDEVIVYQEKISESEYQIIVFNRTQNIPIDSFLTNEKLLSYNIDIDSSLRYVAYERMCNEETEVVLRNLATKFEIVLKGMFPTMIDGILFYFNYSNPEVSTDVSGKIYSFSFKNNFEESKIVLENVIPDDIKIYSTRYLIFGRFVKGKETLYFFDMISKRKTLIELERWMSPPFSYYSFKKNKIIFYDDNNGKLILKELDPREYLNANLEQRF